MAAARNELDEKFFKNAHWFLDHIQENPNIVKSPAYNAEIIKAINSFNAFETAYKNGAELPLEDELILSLNILEVPIDERRKKTYGWLGYTTANLDSMRRLKHNIHETYAQFYKQEYLKTKQNKVSAPSHLEANSLFKAEVDHVLVYATEPVDFSLIDSRITHNEPWKNTGVLMTNISFPKGHRAELINKLKSEDKITSVHGDTWSHSFKQHTFTEAEMRSAIPI